MRENAIRQKWLRIAAQQTDDECFVWPFSTAVNGYGIARGLNGKTTRAHRIVCELVHGKPSGRMDAAHSCGERLCCNPTHLRWATRKDNCADKKEHGTENFGRRNGQAKLTEKQAREIMERRNSGEKLKSVAAAYGVSVMTISDIANGRSWAWLTTKEAAE